MKVDHTAESHSLPGHSHSSFIGWPEPANNRQSDINLQIPQHFPSHRSPQFSSISNSNLCRLRESDLCDICSPDLPVKSADLRPFPAAVGLDNRLGQ